MDRSSDDARRGMYDETIFDDPRVIDGERVVLRAERAQVTKREVEGQRAVVTRRAVTVRRTIEVDVVHEELHVEYRPGSGSEVIAGESEPAAIVVRLHAEEVEIVKHVRVVEEVVLSKRRVLETLPVAFELGHEQLAILDEPGTG